MLQIELKRRLFDAMLFAAQGDSENLKLVALFRQLARDDLLTIGSPPLESEKLMSEEGFRKQQNHQRKMAKQIGLSPPPYRDYRQYINAWGNIRKGLAQREEICCLAEPKSRVPGTLNLLMIPDQLRERFGLGPTKTPADYLQGKVYTQHARETEIILIQPVKVSPFWFGVAGLCAMIHAQNFSCSSELTRFAYAESLIEVNYLCQHLIASALKDTMLPRIDYFEIEQWDQEEHFEHLEQIAEFGSSIAESLAKKYGPALSVAEATYRYRVISDVVQTYTTTHEILMTIAYKRSTTELHIE